jgi:hypothetical protein
MMVFRALERVFQKWEYITLATVVSSVAFALITWLPNLSLVLESFLSEGTIEERTKLPIILLGSIVTNFTLFSAMYTVCIVVLLGVSVSLMVFSFCQRVPRSKSSGVTSSFFGTLSGLLGIGCAACGSVILTPLLAALGATAFLSFLPLEGSEFGMIGVFLLLLSIYVTAKEIEQPAPCKI